MFKSLITVSTLLAAASAIPVVVSPPTHLQARDGFSKSGMGTYYLPQGGYGACGVLLQNGEMIAALDHSQFDGQEIDGNPNHNKVCGRKITVTATKTGKSVSVRLMDRCVRCEAGWIDLSEAAFAQIAPLSSGIIPISWEWDGGEDFAKKVEVEGEGQEALVA
ncbi:hypothetical protein HK101_001364 [Irineochytrium annulatum]|nr:hypothetical protein HK101_001364 [Irineochytrium annulatum]